jgi:O-antigen/teichoic acid export membrane protein
VPYELRQKILPSHDSVASRLNDDLDVSSSREVTRGVARAGNRAIIANLIGATAGLVATPIVVRLLTPDSYGLLAIMQTFILYLALSDFGMGTASTRLGAAAYVSRDSDEEVSVVWTAFLIAITLAAAVALLLVLCASAISHDLLHLRPQLASQGGGALRLVAVVLIARALQGIFNTPLLVRLKWSTYVVINTGTNVMQVLTIPVVLALGGGVVAAVASAAVWSLISLIGIFIASTRLQPGLLHPRFKRSLLRPLVGLGGKVVGAFIAFVVLSEIDKVLVANLVSIRALAYYAVAVAAVQVVQMIPNTCAQPLFAGLSLFLSQDKREEAGILLVRGIRLFLLVSVPVLIAIVSLGRLALRFWAGQVYAVHSTVPLYILAAGTICEGMVIAANQALVAGHRAGTVSIIAFAQIPVYVAVALLAIHLFGIDGAAVAWSAQMTIAMVVLVIIVRQLVPIKFRKISRASAQLSLGVCIGLGPLIAAVGIGAPTWGIVLLGVACLIAYLGFIWTVVLHYQERDWLIQRAVAVFPHFA